MSKDWVNDIAEMHKKFGVREWMQEKIKNKEYDLLKKYLAFRLLMTYEELGETLSAATVQGDSEEVVDGLIDLCVFAIGTLDVMGVDAYKAWDEIHRANMIKEPGVKPGRPNKFGMPDLIKQEGWVGPDHTGNHGYLPEIMK